jgi:hypothetical protein
MLYPRGGRRQRANVTSQVWWRKPATSSAKMDTAAPAGHPVFRLMFLMTFVMNSMLLGVESLDQELVALSDVGDRGESCFSSTAGMLVRSFNGRRESDVATVTPS